jgi:glucosamine--fructose-6-phosphate aminotransferase (isomerizing)
MLDEIREQPDAVNRVLQNETRSAQLLAEQIRSRKLHNVIIAARGTSDNAATYAKYLFEIVAGLPVALAAPSVYTLYDARVDLTSTLVLGISQSGRGSDVVQVLSSARAYGAITACITNDPSSPITDVSDHVLLCNAGEELAVAATKTYTTSLAAVALLVAVLTGDARLTEALKTLPQNLSAAVALEPQVQRAVERFRYMRECAVLARGLNQATALEAALKMTETCYVVAKPYSGADFLHGPIAMVDSGFPCFLFAPDGRALPSMLELAGKIRSKFGEMVVFANDRQILETATVPIPMPENIDELVSPLSYIVPGQYFAYHLSRLCGFDPDAPRGLTKVTSTR